MIRFTAKEAVKSKLFPASIGTLYDMAKRHGMPKGEFVERDLVHKVAGADSYVRRVSCQAWTRDELAQLTQEVFKVSARIRARAKREGIDVPAAVAVELELPDGPPVGELAEPVVLVHDPIEPTPLQNLRLALDNLDRAIQWVNAATAAVQMAESARAERMAKIASELLA